MQVSVNPVLDRFSCFSKCGLSQSMRSLRGASGTFDSTAYLAQSSLQFTSAFERSGATDRLKGSLGHVRDSRDLIDTIFVAFSVLSLQFLFAKNKDGSFKTKEKGNHKVYVVNHLCSLLSEIVFLANRIINMCTYLHRTKACNIGQKHYDRMGYAIMAGFTAMSVLSIVESVDNHLQAKGQEYSSAAERVDTQRKTASKISTSVIGLLSTANQFGMISGHPLAQAIGGLVGCTSALIDLLD